MQIIGMLTSFSRRSGIFKLRNFFVLQGPRGVLLKNELNFGSEAQGYLVPSRSHRPEKIAHHETYARYGTVSHALTILQPSMWNEDVSGSWSGRFAGYHAHQKALTVIENRNHYSRERIIRIAVCPLLRIAEGDDDLFSRPYPALEIFIPTDRVRQQVRKNLVAHFKKIASVETDSPPSLIYTQLSDTLLGYGVETGKPWFNSKPLTNAEKRLVTPIPIPHARTGATSENSEGSHVYSWGVDSAPADAVVESIGGGRMRILRPDVDYTIDNLTGRIRFNR